MTANEVMAHIRSLVPDALDDMEALIEHRTRAAGLNFDHIPPDTPPDDPRLVATNLSYLGGYLIAKAHIMAGRRFDEGIFDILRTQYEEVLEGEGGAG